MEETNENKSKKISKKFLLLSLLIASIFLIVTAVFGYVYYEQQQNKKVVVKIYPEVSVKNEGFDPKDTQKKIIIDSFNLFLIDRGVLEAKIKIRKMQGKTSVEEGTNFVIFDFRKPEDYKKSQFDFSVNVTPETFLAELEKHEVTEKIYLVSYQEKEDDILWAAKACLIQGFMNPVGVKGGYSN